MTREEAIYILKNTAWLGTDKDREDTEQAINTAIEALSAKPSGDIISRQDAIDVLGEEPEIWNDTEEEWAYRNAWVEHISAIKALPSVEAEAAEPKTGEWIDDCSCSICHWIHEDNNGFALITKYNFCPNCGARMKGADDE